MKIVRRMLSASLLVILLAATVLAQGLPKANSPEEVGMSSERLSRLTSGLKADVDKGVIPGAVGIILRKGKIAYLEAIGFQDREKQTPMSNDSHFSHLLHE